jgi:rhamnosyl/mannosyltransferase
LKKHILHIGKYYPPYFGGIEKVTFDIVESLNQSNIKTDVLCFNHESFPNLEQRDYNVIRCKPSFNLFSTPVSFEMFNKFRHLYNQYDIVHLHLPNPIGVLVVLFSGFKGKLVIHWHSDIIKQKKLKLLFAPFEKLILKKANRIIVTSGNYLSASNSLFAFQKKCTIIPIGISNDEFISNPLFEKELFEQLKGKKMIFSLGRLIYYKGFDYLISLAVSLPTDVVIYIGGVGELEPTLKNQISSLGLDSKVKLIGSIPFTHLGEYYKRADIFCLSSIEKSEAFGVVLIEAMSFGCPIVSFEIPGSGVPWVNKNHDSGLVVPLKDIEAMSEAIIFLLNNPEERDRLGKGAFNRFNNLFTKERMVESTIRLYEELI